jgi:uncharacterized membrane protein
MGHENESGEKPTDEREQLRADAKAGISTGRAFERLISLSDAVVAVAITLNVLALIEIRPTEGESAWNVLSEHGGELVSFVYTFIIVAVMWLAHNRILNRMRGYDSRIFWLNLLWLLLVVLLPWPTAMYGESLGLDGSGGAEPIPGIGMFYWTILAAISATGALMGLRCRHHPDLLERPETAHQISGQIRAWAFAAFFLLIGVVSLFSYPISTWLPVGLIVLAVVFRRFNVS